jgi:hypothetical protein
VEANRYADAAPIGQNEVNWPGKSCIKSRLARRGHAGIPFVPEVSAPKFYLCPADWHAQARAD